MKEEKKKMGTSSKIFLGLLAVCLVAGVSVAITLALLSTNSNKKENTFVGDPGLALNLYETTWDGSTATDPTNDDSGTNSDRGKKKAENYSASDSIPKDPKLYNASVNKVEWVSARVRYYIKNASDTYVLVPYSQIKKFATIKTGGNEGFNINASGWLADTSNADTADTHYFYYQTALSKQTSTDALFETVDITSSDILKVTACDGASCSKKYYDGNGAFHFHFTPTTGSSDEFEINKLPEFKIEVDGSAQEKASTDTTLTELIKTSLKGLFQ